MSEQIGRYERKVASENYVRAAVEISLGTVNNVPTARARVTRMEHVVGEFGVQKWMPKETMIIIERTVETIDYPELRPKRQSELDQRLGKPDTQSRYGRLHFAMLDMVKGKLEMRTQCWRCGAGSVWFKRIQRRGEGALNRTYIAQWKKVAMHEDHICERCWEQEHPVRGVFNPHPEKDREDPDYPSNRDNIFYDAVNELVRTSRDSLYEDVDFMYTLDAQATNEFLSGEPSEPSALLSGEFGRAAVEILTEEVSRKGIFERSLSADF